MIIYILNLQVHQSQSVCGLIPPWREPLKYFYWEKPLQQYTIKIAEKSQRTIYYNYKKMIDELQLGTLINKCKHLMYKFAGVYAADILLPI